MVQFLLWSAMNPDKAICFGGTWRIPVLCGLLEEDFVDDLKNDSTYDQGSFVREYESVWGGGTDGAFFSAEDFDKQRLLRKPAFNAPLIKKARYFLGYDVGRLNDQSSGVLLQAIPDGSGQFRKDIVNIYAFDETHFLKQANEIKRLILKFNIEKVVFDANGLGVGLLDFLIIETRDDITGEVFPPIGIDRHSDKQRDYANFYAPPGGLPEVIYMVKATDTLNHQMHNIASSQISNRKVNFLIDDQHALELYKRTDKYKMDSIKQREEYMKPFKLTKILREEMLNLRRVEKNGKSSVKRISGAMRKDKFSAFEMVLWYVKGCETKVIRNYTGRDGNSKVSLATNNGIGDRTSIGNKFGKRGEKYSRR